MLVNKTLLEFPELVVSPEQGKFVEFIQPVRVILEKLKNHKTWIPFLKALSSPRVYRSKLKANRLVQ